MNRVGRLLKDLTGRSDEDLIGPIVRQLDAALDGAGLARAAVMGTLPSSEARTRMADVEHEGDRERALLVRALSKSLTAPIDREDLFRLSRSADDILDDLRDFVRELELFDAAPMPALAPIIDAVARTIQLLRVATERLLQDLATVREAALAAKKSDSEVRRLYQSTLAAILQDPVMARTLQQQALLRRLDIVGLRLGESADAISDAVLKRSY